ARQVKTALVKQIFASSSTIKSAITETIWMHATGPDGLLSSVRACREPVEPDKRRRFLSRPIGTPLQYTLGLFGLSASQLLAAQGGILAKPRHSQDVTDIRCFETISGTSALEGAECTYTRRDVDDKADYSHGITHGIFTPYGIRTATRSARSRAIVFY